MDVTRLSASLFRRLVSTVYPPYCMLCNAPGFNDMDICPDCYRNLPWIGSACVQCGIPLPENTDEQLRCGHCLQKPPAFDRSLSLFRYDKDVISLVHQLKFKHKLANSRLLGNMLAETIHKHAVALPDCILPVPIHRKRLRQRGFNQSVELARPVAGAFGIPVDVGSVVRSRNTHAQTGLDRKQRRKNMRGAFEIVQPLNTQHLAILDDVVTTMSTVNELARLLKKSGVARVDIWSIARAV